MKKIRIGVVSPSEIAYRRFMPALMKCEDFEYVGVAVADKDEWHGNLTDKILKEDYEKAQSFIKNFGGEIFTSYSALIKRNDVDAIYMPLPPALHYKWGEKVLENDKHLLIEKPSTTNCEDTKKLVDLAKSKNLVLHENYMFIFHSQLEIVKKIIAEKKIGDVRLYRIAFGFPMRDKNDFRYKKELGGGALHDCGGYTLRLASILLGDTARITASNLNYSSEFDVDLFGSATIQNDDGITAQLSFGMDNNYKCELEVWGSKGTMYSNRIFSAPVEYKPELYIKLGNEPIETMTLESDDTFMKSIMFFERCIFNDNLCKNSYKSIIKQAEFLKEYL